MQSYISNLFQCILKDIGEVFIYLPYGIALLLLMVVFFEILYRQAVKHGKTFTVKIWPMAALTGYSMIILMITFFSRDSGARDGMDLIPFATIGNGVQGDAYVVENILLFIPLGILLPIAFGQMRRLLPCVSVGFLIGMVIEISQLQTKRGYVQTDDVIMNTLGTAIGYGIMAWILKIRTRAQM